MTIFLFPISALQARRYSYGNPIWRKGVVVPIRNSKYGLPADVDVRTPHQHAQYNRRIRDPGGVRYNHSRSSPRVKHWMESYGAGRDTPYPLDSGQTFDGGLLPNIHQKDHLHPYSPHREVEQDVFNDWTRTIPDGGFQGRQLHRPRGFPRFQKRQWQPDLCDAEAFQWDVVPCQNLNMSLQRNCTVDIQESSIAANEGRDFLAGQCHHSGLTKIHDETFPGREDNGNITVGSWDARQQLNPPFWREHDLSYPMASRVTQTFQQQPGNDWDVLTRLVPTPGMDQRGPTSTVLTRSVNEQNSPAANYSGDNGGLSRFQRYSHDDSPCKDNRKKSKPLNLSAALPQIPQGIARFSLSVSQPQPEPEYQPSLRFFNNGLEIDINGHPLSRSGSPNPYEVRSNIETQPDSDSRLLDSFLSPDDDALWNHCF